MLLVYYIATLILTNQLVMAAKQCEEYQIQSPFFLGTSCDEIYNMNPESQDKSGYYWILLDGLNEVYCGMNYTGSSCEAIYIGNFNVREKSGYYRINNTRWTFCNMTEIAIAAGFDVSTCAGVGGGWKRIVSINISAGDDCPTEWRKDTHSGVSFCRIDSDNPHTCSYTNFSTNGTSYQRVCGRARGYQKGHMPGFFDYHNNGQTIDGRYATGLLVTYDSLRQHIWTYTMGYSCGEQMHASLHYIIVLHYELYHVLAH